MPSNATRRLIRERLNAETGRIERQAPCRIALAYPSPYAVGMSSLGYQAVYRIIQSLPAAACERFFLADGGDRPGAEPEAPVSYEGMRPLSEFPVIAFSVAYELELVGLIRMLERSGISADRSARRPEDPLVVAGGPLTFSNPGVLAPLVDAVVVGEAEEIVPFVVETVFSGESRREVLAALAEHPHIFVPEVHGSELRSVAACDDALLPAASAITTPFTELSNMFLVEPERGCSRGCTYCVMRRTTNGGMRIVPKETVLERIPETATRVGLVGAAVSDHPKIVEIVSELAERGLSVGLSSLRPDRLKEDFVFALRRAGYKTLTTALDGPSERLRGLIDRRGREPHYVAAAEHARKYGMDRLKLYLMLGLPGETDADIDECAAFVEGLSKIVPVALGIAPFCSKRNTPLDGLPYAGVERVQKRLERLRSKLKGRADVRATSAKWAWVEHVLAQGGEAEGRAALEATRSGARYADFRRTFEKLGHRPDGAGYLEAEVPLPPEIKGPRRLRLLETV